MYISERELQSGMNHSGSAYILDRGSRHSEAAVEEVFGSSIHTQGTMKRAGELKIEHSKVSKQEEV
jgi:hypothetical protein